MLFVPQAQARAFFFVTFRRQNAPYVKAASRPKAVHELTLVPTFTASSNKKMDDNNF